MSSTRGRRKKRPDYVALSFALFACVFFTYACNSQIRQYTRPDTDLTTIKRVAVLPLENYTSENFAGGRIKSLVIMELLARGVDVIEPGEVTRALRELKVRSTTSIMIEDIIKMGELLNIDAVIIGSVETFGISKGVSVSYPEVSIHMMMLGAATGNIIWSVWHTNGGASFWTRHFGAEDWTLDETARQVVKEAFDTLFL